MALPVSIPLVTNDDLITFHKHAFGTAPPLHSLPHFPTSPWQTGLNGTHNSHVAEKDDDDDGLGYYPDGQKRTLTDEQVAMFRHSEIYSIVRARQVKRENEGLDEEEEGADGTAATADGETPSAVSPLEEKKIRVTAGGSRDDDVIDDDPASPPASRGLDPPYACSRQKRRKLNRQRNTEEAVARRDEIPSRRLIREMDAAVEVDPPELDY